MILTRNLNVPLRKNKLSATIWVSVSYCLKSSSLWRKIWRENLENLKEKKKKALKYLKKNTTRKKSLWNFTMQFTRWSLNSFEITTNLKYMLANGLCSFLMMWRSMETTSCCRLFCNFSKITYFSSITSSLMSWSNTWLKWCQMRKSLQTETWQRSFMRKNTSRYFGHFVFVENKYFQTTKFLSWTNSWKDSRILDTKIMISKLSRRKTKKESMILCVKQLLISEPERKGNSKTIIKYVKISIDLPGII